MAHYLKVSEFAEYIEHSFCTCCFRAIGASMSYAFGIEYIVLYICLFCNYCMYYTFFLSIFIL